LNTPKLVPVKGSELLRKLQRAGFIVARQEGNKYQLKHPQTGRVTYVHLHGRREIPVGTLRAILRQAGLSVGEFNEL
jgi:predicted RNA binding protein YcfA (HicA-like mRNA interferase family)